MPITIELKNDPYYNQGLEQGLEQGLKQGEKKGIIKGKIFAFYELGISEKEIAKKLNISIEKVREYLKGN